MSRMTMAPQNHHHCRGSGEPDLEPLPSTARSAADSGTMPGEKRREPGLSRAGLDASSPVSRFYLSFGTALPELRAPAGRELPPCPDLRPYMAPVEWSPVRENVVLAMSCIATFLTAYTAGAYTPPAAIMADDLGTSRTVVRTAREARHLRPLATRRPSDACRRVRLVEQIDAGAPQGRRRRFGRDGSDGW